MKVNQIQKAAENLRQTCINTIKHIVKMCDDEIDFEDYDDDDVPLNASYIFDIVTPKVKYLDEGGAWIEGSGLPEQVEYDELIIDDLISILGALEIMYPAMADIELEEAVDSVRENLKGFHDFFDDGEHDG